MNNYVIGQTVRLKAEFTDANGTLTDPTSVTVSIKAPGESAVSYSGVKDSVGKYRYDYDPAVAGRHEYKWFGTGALKAAGQGSFYVERNNVG